MERFPQHKHKHKHTASHTARNRTHMCPTATHTIVCAMCMCACVSICECAITGLYYTERFWLNRSISHFPSTPIFHTQSHQSTVWARTPLNICPDVMMCTSDWFVYVQCTRRFGGGGRVATFRVSTLRKGTLCKYVCAADTTHMREYWTRYSLIVRGSLCLVICMRTFCTRHVQYTVLGNTHYSVYNIFIV